MEKKKILGLVLILLVGFTFVMTQDIYDQAIEQNLVIAIYESGEARLEPQSYQFDVIKFIESNFTNG